MADAANSLRGRTPEFRLDLSRSERIDLPEAVFCEAKTDVQCVSIVAAMIEAGVDAVIATRATDTQMAALSDLAPSAYEHRTATWNHRPRSGASVALVAAGTSDLAVAAECRLTLAALGHEPVSFTDVGVAGLHRLIDVAHEIENHDVVITFAGMEGALPTVLAGLVSAPVIAVPTSVGYGVSTDGRAALRSALASCAPGVAVVNIDNGYGAACAAHRILRRVLSKQEASKQQASKQQASKQGAVSESAE